MAGHRILVRVAGPLMVVSGLLAFGPSGILSTPAQAQVVQLPTFHIFSVSTTVSVPDRGGILAGGVQRSRAGSVSAGTPIASHLPWLDRLSRTRGFGVERGSSTVSVHATVHDLLGPPPATRTAADSTSAARQRKAFFLAGHVDRTGDAVPSVRAILQQQQAAERQRAAELAAHLARGRAAESAGRLGAARSAYQIVARQAEGVLQREAFQRLAQLQRDTQKE